MSVYLDIAPTDEAEAEQAASRLRALLGVDVGVTAEKALPDIASPALWAALRAALMPSIDAMFHDAFMRGARLALTQRPVRAHKDNPNHDELGRFASGPGGGRMTAREAVIRYAGGPAGGAVNDVLRGEPQHEIDKNEARDIIAGLDLAFASPRNVVGRRTELYRGTRLPDEYDNLKPGDTITDRAFVSTTLYSNRFRFSGYRDSLLITAPKGTPAVRIRSLGPQGEDEVLLNRGTVLRVDYVEGDLHAVVPRRMIRATVVVDGAKDNPNHDELGRFASGPGGWALPAPGAARPPKPGTVPLPKGMVRVYHYIGSNTAHADPRTMLESILKEGLLTEHAQGHLYGEPDQVWASFTRPSDELTYVEIAVSPDEVDIGGPSPGVTYPQGRTWAEHAAAVGSNITLKGDVPASRILTYSEPWMRHYDYIMDDPSAKASVIAGEFDTPMFQGPDYGPAIALIKAGKSLDDLLAIMSGERATPAVAPNPARVTQAAQDVIDTYSDVWWEQFTATTQARLRDAIADAEANGLTIDETIDEFAPLFGPARAEAIAVTETTRLMGMGAVATYEALGFGGWAIRTAEDAHVEPVCDELGRRSDAGETFSIDDPFHPVHVNCLLPGTVVSGAVVEGACARPYNGEAVIIRTASGKRLTVTPNHPVLTPRGWVAAGVLREGDQVIEDSREQGVAPVVSPDDVEMPARVEEVAGALLGAGGVRSVSVPVAAEDFHGDGSEGEVDVVWANCALRDRYEPTVGEPLQQQALVRTRSAEVAIASSSTTQQFIVAGDASTSSGIRSGNLLAALLGVHGGPLQALGVALAARLNTGTQQPSPDRVALHAEVLGNRVLGHATEVQAYSLCLVVAVETIRYTGHVYNLQTTTGRYTANGIVTHNCRCWPVPADAPAEGAPTFDEVIAELEDLFAAA